MTGALQIYLNYGLDRIDERDRRGARLSNLLSFVGTIASVTFACLYLFQDASGLGTPAAVCLLAAPMFFATPLAMRFGILFPATLIVCNLLTLTIINTFLMSRDSGLHTAMVVTLPMVGILLLGVKRLAVIAVFALIGAAASLLPEIYFTQSSELVRVEPPFLLQLRLNIMISNGIIMSAAIFYAMWRMTQAEESLEMEHARSERLLENLLPKEIAARFKAEPDQIIADKLDAVTILFADIADFTPRAADMPAQDLVAFLNEVFTAFDTKTDALGLEKIKTIGDAYMVVAGLSDCERNHADAAAQLALSMLEICSGLSEKIGERVSVRIGIHTGTAVAGVIGRRKVFYDIWGDAVNLAARMESHGEPGRIQISTESRNALSESYQTERRGLIDIKGKGPTETWWLVGHNE
ncbi:MAG: adenylate/guanylate cyclase domain-containing protein [Pseudomonadota bacterium]